MLRLLTGNILDRRNFVKTLKLREISELKTGPFGTQFSAKEYVSEGIPVINVKNIGYGNIISEGLDYVGNSTLERLSEHKLKTGDIVFGRKGSVDRHCLITKEQDGWMQGSDCIRVRLTDASVYSNFISYYLLTDAVKTKINNSAVGSTMASLNTDILGDVDINLPCYEEQYKIASVLSTIDQKIEKNKEINDYLEEMAKTIYDYWFIQFDFPGENGKPYKSSGGKMSFCNELNREIPQNWNYTSIGNITICLDSERIPLSNQQREGMKGSIPYYGATGIMDYVNRPIFSGNFVLLAEDGSVMDDNGNPILQRVSGDVWINNHTHVLQPVKGYSCRLLYLLLKDIPVSIIKTGSIQMKINQANLNNYNILSIPDAIRTQFINCVEPLDTKIMQIQQENNNLIQFRDWLLPMLMNGQATIEDCCDK